MRRKLHLKRIIIFATAVLLILVVAVLALRAVLPRPTAETAADPCANDAAGCGAEELPTAISVAAATVIAPTATPSPLPPTPVPSPSPTPEPTAEPVFIPPYPEAPPCPDHDDRVYHGLWDGERGCHYDHEHGRAYPAWAQELWGDYTVLTGYEIGYPWETEGENAYKHPGYNFDGYDFRGSCMPFVSPGGVDAWFVQAHGMANEMGQQARVHSFFGLAHLCNEDGAAGVVISGGHADFGQLVSPYKGGPEAVVGADVYAKAPQVYADQLPPYVGMARSANRFSFETWNSSARDASAPFVDAHQIFTFAFRISDPVGAWQTDGQFIAYGGNSSARQMYQIEIDIRQFAEFTDANGLIQYSGFTDVHGVPDAACSSAGPNCVTLIIRDAVPGRYSVNGPAAGLFGLRDFFEGDIYFDGQPSGWIGPMN
jgi:hypothetical protein